MNKTEVSIKPVGDQAVLVCFGNQISPEINDRVIALEQAVKQQNIFGVFQAVPSFTSLLVCYDALVTDYAAVKIQLERMLQGLEQAENKAGKRIEIPVCYGGRYGEDLAFVAEHAGLTQQEVIQIHSGRSYRIYMIGFLPGFPYLGGLDARIHTPRLAVPRTKIPAGSVGIGGEQTGIYPMESPGGWQLIGRTPLQLMDPQRKTPLYQTGDEIRFVPITEAEYVRIRQQEMGERS